jgi:DNA-binding CsgD family transcriptional regulator
VSALGQSDLQAALDFLCEAEAVTGPDPFPTELLDRLRELVPCDFVSYNELDQVEERVLLLDACSNSCEAGDDPDDSDVEIFWRFKDQHPVCRHHARTLDFSALKISDFLSRRELHRLDYYDHVLRPFGIEDTIVVGLPATLRHTKCFLLNSQGRDFDERDRELLDTLRPHFPALYANARARRVAGAIAAGDDAAGELVVLSPSGAIDFETAGARELLARYFPGGHQERLPQDVDSWLREQTSRLNGHVPPTSPARSFTARRETATLVISRLGHTLLLREEPATLTPREHEILDLLAEGCSNAEIASALWIAPGTVRKHLENIYAKLGVRSRTAALARLRRC